MVQFFKKYMLYLKRKLYQETQNIKPYLYCEFASKMLNILRCQIDCVEIKVYVHTVFQLILFFKRQVINT